MNDIIIYKPAGNTVTVLDGAPPADPAPQIAALNAQIATDAKTNAALDAEVVLLVKQVDMLQQQLAALQTPPPPPKAVPFPSGYTQPTGAQLAPSDVINSIGTRTAATWRTLDDRRGGGYSPGCWYSNYSSRIQFAHEGGDWYDLADAAQGTNAWAAASIAYGARGACSIDVQLLVAATMPGGTFPNYGMMLLTDGKATVNIASRFDADPAKHPALVVNGVTVPCGRSQWLVPSQVAMAGLGGNANLQIAATGRALLWFDLSQFAGGPITSAVLSLYVTGTFDGPWPMTLKVMRAWNPGDQSTLPPVELGLAQDYIKDAGIEKHHDVIFAQQFTDPAASALWLKGNETTASIVTAPDGNGFQMPAGLPAIKATFTPPLMSALQVFTPLPEWEDGHMRYLWLLGDDWDPRWNPSGKMSGWDMSYFNPLKYNMGVGHGSSGCDGLTGSSARGSYDSPAFGDDPMAGYTTVGMGGDYNADTLSASGTSTYFGRQYLSMLRRGEWNSIETQIVLNTVDHPIVTPSLVTSMTCVGTTATVTFKDPQIMATGPETWTFGGASWSDNSVNYSGVKTVTWLNRDQCTFQVPAGTIAVANKMTDSYNNPVPYFLAIPGQGRKDGILRMWINGRLAGEWTDMRWRHSRLRPDGGVYGLANAWWISYTGGRNPPLSPASCYLAALVVAKSYIGPMMVAP